MQEAQSTAPFGQWLKQRRKELYLTQEGLAQRIGCSDIAIRKIESGTRRPSKQVAELLADLFKVPAAEREAFVIFARGLDDRARPPERISQQPPGNLPALLARLIGRDEVAAEIGRLLLQDEVHLLTLTGPPGIGKTRLALQVASDVAVHFDDGVYFVPLAPISDPGLVAPAIAQAIGVSVSGGISMEERLAQHLDGKEELLLLDNFEQVVQATSLISYLLTACPRLKLLVTSRELLRVQGEHRFPVPPLALPERAHLQDLALLTECPSVALFTQRARAIKHDFDLTEENAQSVAEICIRLDGMPLPLELAAARITLLSPREIVGQLDSHLKLLVGGARDLPPRQATLRGALEWSYALLDAGERLLFARLAVFVGGCTLSAAQAICNARGDLPFDLLHGLSSLIDKSLLKREQLLGESRYSMLEMVREYAAERLDEGGEGADIKRVHAEYHLLFAEAAASQLESPEQAAWLNRLESIHDDMRAALQWSECPEGDPQLGLRLAVALAPFWTVRGYFDEARDRLSRVFSRYEGQKRSILLARAYARAGRFAFRQSDYAAARRYYAESLAMSKELGDKYAIAVALKGLGNVATEEGDYLKASDLFEQGIAMSRELGDPLQLADYLVGSAWAAVHQSNFALATSQFEEALSICRALEHKEEAAFALSGLGEVAVRQGDYARAEILLEESLTMRREIDDRWGTAISLGTMAWAALRQGDDARARQLLKESIGMRKELGDKGGIAWCLERFAEIERKRGRSERAARLYGAADDLRQRVDTGVDPPERSEHERSIALARAQLGPARWDSAWAVGRAMSLRAVEWALEEE
jgi:predicted ATPase/DNA-binding XRE family transcriptional regulator